MPAPCFPSPSTCPHFQSGANRIGKHARALPPIQSPEKVARAIASLAERLRRKLHVPRIAALGLVVHYVLPETTERRLLRALRRWHFEQRCKEDRSIHLGSCLARTLYVRARTQVKPEST